MSFVVHVIVLLVLAFWITSDDRPRPLALVIDTEDPVDPRPGSSD